MAIANVYDQYAAANSRLAKGERLFFTGRSGQARITDRITPGCRRLRYPRIGVFCGDGTSHSWLWFADLFERMGFHNLSFLDHVDVQEGHLRYIDVLAISGGDTFAIATALGRKGADEVKRFIENGGLYIGSCAGAYLAMNSSKPPLNLFNYAAVKITNLSKYLPHCRNMPTKFSTVYGCCFVFHPVRESIGLRANGTAPFAGAGSLMAPLYGGPGMKAHGNTEVLVHYEAFTDHTVFLVNQALAHDTLIGKAAAVRGHLGDGRLYLFGPHLEHPHYPQANRLVADAILWDAGRLSDDDPAYGMAAECLSGDVKRDLIKDLKRELSNSRIVASGLEFLPIRWLIGAKYYEPEKIRVFLDSMWRRLIFFEDRDKLWSAPTVPAELLAMATDITRMLRLIKNKLDQEQDTLAVAGRLFNRLHKFTALFLNLYFLNVSGPN